MTVEELKKAGILPADYVSLEERRKKAAAPSGNVLSLSQAEFYQRRAGDGRYTPQTATQVQERFAQYGKDYTTGTRKVTPTVAPAPMPMTGKTWVTEPQRGGRSFGSQDVPHTVLQSPADAQALVDLAAKDIQDIGDAATSQYFGQDGTLRFRPQGTATQYMRQLNTAQKALESAQTWARENGRDAAFLQPRIDEASRLSENIGDIRSAQRDFNEKTWGQAVYADNVRNMTRDELAAQTEGLNTQEALISTVERYLFEADSWWKSLSVTSDDKASEVIARVDRRYQEMAEMLRRYGYDITYDGSYESMKAAYDAINEAVEELKTSLHSKRRSVEDAVYQHDLNDLHARYVVRTDWAANSHDVEDQPSYYANMDDKERQIYNYLYRTEGKQSAKAYHESIKNRLVDRWEADELEASHRFAKKHQFWGSVASVGANLLSPFEYIGDMANYIATGHLDDNVMAATSSTTRAAVTDTVNVMIGDWDAFDFVYNTTMSGVDSLIAAGVTAATGVPVGGAMLGLSAAASGTNDALERGLTNGQAFLTGVVQGVFEGFFESVSIGNLLNEVSVSGLKSFAKNLVVSMGVNASEETLTELANVVYDTVANGGLSHYALVVEDYMAQGMSEREARKKAAQDIALQIGEAGASGALMGLGFSAANSARSYVGNVQTGKTLNSKGLGNAIVAFGMTMDSGSEAHNFAAELTSKAKVTDADVGKLYGLIAEQAQKMTPQQIFEKAKAARAKTAPASSQDNIPTIPAADTAAPVAPETVAQPTKERTVIDDAVDHMEELRRQNVENGAQYGAGATLGTNAETMPPVSNPSQIAAQTPQTANADAVTGDPVYATAASLQGKTYQDADAMRYTKAIGRDVYFYKGDPRAENGFAEDGKIYVNTARANPLHVVVAHELTHTLQNTKEYGELVIAIKDSAAFRDYLREKGTTFHELVQTKINTNRKARPDFDATDAEYEIFADFVGNVLIHNEQHLTELATRQPQWFAKLREFVSRILTKLGVSRAERWQIESIFARAHQAALASEAQKNPATESGRWYMMPDGYVLENWMHDSADSKYSYESLIAKPDMIVIGVDDSQGTYDKHSIKEGAVNNASSVGYINDEGHATVHINAENIDVVVTNRSIIHGLDRRMKTQGPVLMRIGEVLQNSISINSLVPRGESIASSTVLVGAARGAKGLYVATFVVNKATNELDDVYVLYAANVKMEPAALPPKITEKTVTPTDSTISIANLLKLVNKYYPDILPSNVLQHFTYDERPSGKIGSSALYSITDEDVPSASVGQSGTGDAASAWDDDTATAPQDIMSEPMSEQEYERERDRAAMMGVDLESMPPKPPKMSPSLYIQKTLDDPTVPEVTKAYIREQKNLWPVLSNAVMNERATTLLNSADGLASIVEKIGCGEAVLPHEMRALQMAERGLTPGAEAGRMVFITAQATHTAGQVLGSIRHGHTKEQYENMTPEERKQALMGDVRFRATAEALGCVNDFIDRKYHKGAGGQLDKAVLAFEAAMLADPKLKESGSFHVAKAAIAAVESVEDAYAKKKRLAGKRFKQLMLRALQDKKVQRQLYDAVRDGTAPMDALRLVMNDALGIRSLTTDQTTFIQNIGNRIGLMMNEMYTASEDLDAKYQRLVEIDAEIIALEKYVADHLTINNFERLNSWRKFAMLSNLRTHARNLLSTAAQYPVRKIDDFVAWGLESACRAVLNRFGRADAMTLSRFVTWRMTEHGKSIMDTVKWTAELAVREMRTDLGYDRISAKSSTPLTDNMDDMIAGMHGITEELISTRKVSQARAMFGKRGNIPNWLSEKNSDILEKEDQFFFRNTLIDELGQRMTAAKVTVPTQEMITEARQAALYAVFRAENNLSEAVLAFKNRETTDNATLNAALQSVEAAADIILPFVHTPSNLLLNAVDHSPIGFIRTLWKIHAKMKNNENYTLSDLCQMFARNITGVGIWALGVLLVRCGALTVFEDDDDEYNEASGNQEFSLKIFGHKISVDWLQPIALPFLMGAAYTEAFETEDAEWWDSFWKASSAMGKVALDQSYFQSVQQVFDTSDYSYLDYGSATLLNIAKSLTGQMIPTAVGQMARTVDPTQRKVWSNEKGMLGALETMMNTALSRVPGLSYLLDPKVDMWGKDAKRSNYGTATNAAQQFLVPWSQSKSAYADDITTQALLDIFDEAKAKQREINADASLSAAEKKEALAEYTTSPIFNSGDIGKNWTDPNGDLISEDEEVVDEATRLLRQSYKAAADLLVPSKEFSAAETPEKIDLLKAMYDDIYEMTKKAFKSMPADEAVDTVEDYLETVKEAETYDPDIVNAYATVTLYDGKPLITNKDLCARYKKAVDDVYEKRMKKGVYEWTENGEKKKLYINRATDEELAFIEAGNRERARSDIATLFKKVDAETLIAELDRYSADIVRRRLL